jgi:CHAT domain-containing protein/tetratricopeptide (TPR) repeat protein
MRRTELINHLLETNDREKHCLLYQKYSNVADLKLAEEIKDTYYDSWTKEPQRTRNAADALDVLSEIVPCDEVKGLQSWVRGIADLTNGDAEKAIENLDNAADIFATLDKPAKAARTQVGKLYALGLLGRYDEAVDCGLRARDVFLADKDIYTAAKIEHNIGNLFARRDLYRECEPYFFSSHERFSEIGDQQQLAMVENSLAFVKSLQNDFREAESIYEQARKRAELNGLTVTQAEIETSLSNLYLFQGRLDLALNFMESSRRKYDDLDLPHQTAICELEIADIYLELNLLPEAVEFYERSELRFSEFGMQAELARCFLNHAKVLFLQGDNQTSSQYLIRSHEIYVAEGNEILAASAKLFKAQILLTQELFDEAEIEAAAALRVFKKGGNIRYELFANWIIGAVFAKKNKIKKAKSVFLKNLGRAKNHSRQIEYLCFVSLGKLLNGEDFFLKAVAIAENSRAALASESFRTAFFTDKVLPFNELARIKLAQNKPRDAFKWHERSRSRSLNDAMNSATPNHFENPKLAALREELNWSYSRINRQSETGLEARKHVASIRNHAEALEKQYAEMARRSEISETFESARVQKIDIEALQRNLRGKVLIEFANFGSGICAFVITDQCFEVIEINVGERDLQTEIEQFLFQIKTARVHKNLSEESCKISFQRLLRRSQALYEILLKPLEGFCGNKNLKIVPNGNLHYLPFQALHNGEQFLIETNEISYAPSAAIFQTCQSLKYEAIESLLLVGVADAKTPLVKTEIETLSKLFNKSISFLDEDASIKNLRENLQNADILHLACHGNFRPDNPAFSSLALFSENLTADQVKHFDLRNKLVTLSACETGMNKVVSGEELLGLSRGFLAAGASSLLMSLWTVNDRSTLDLMKVFYRQIANGDEPVKALQHAQITALKENPNPYFWAPFVLIGK